MSSVISTIAEADPTGLTGLIPGNGRFRFYSVVARVQAAPADYGSLSKGDAHQAHCDHG